MILGCWSRIVFRITSTIAVVAVAGHPDVAPLVEVGSDALFEVGQDLGERLLVAQDHVGEEEAGEDPVALGDVAAEAEAARLLPAQHGVDLHHLGRDVLEPDRHLVDGDAELLGELVGHRRHVQGADHGPTHAPDLEQVEHQQGVDLELVDEAAALVDDAQPVGVAVGGDAEVVAARLHGRQGGAQVGRDRLRVDAAEEGVAIGVELDDPRRAAAQHA